MIDNDNDPLFYEKKMYKSLLTPPSLSLLLRKGDVLI